MNLWAEFDNKQAPPESAGRGRTRRLTEQFILSSLRNWLLHDYVAPYCRSLGTTRIYPRCYWIDALGAATRTNSLSSDPGDDRKNRKKNAIQSLPPILASIASLSQELAQESKPIALHAIILEAGSSKRQETREMNRPAKAVHSRGDPLRSPWVAKDANEKNPGVPAKDATLPRESGIVRASWLEIAPVLLKEIEQSPAIFLLNPFGHSVFTYDDLAPLYQRTAPTELCLLISHHRCIASLHASAKTSAFTALLRTDRWKALLPKAEETTQAVDGVIDLLIASMQRDFLSVQRIALPVQVRPAVVETAPYTLLFATRRQDSLGYMNDAVCVYRRRLAEQSHQGILGEEWFVSQQQERLTEGMQQLYQRTLQQGRARRARRWPDLRQQLLISNFGQFTIRDYDEVMRKIIANGEVRCEWRNVGAPLVGAPVSTPSPLDARVPGNDDTLFWH